MLRFLRIAVGLALLVAAGWTLAPHVTGVVGTSGVVNAPLVTLRSPVDGHVTEATRAPGTPLRHGERVFAIEGARSARDALEEAELRERQLESEALALTAQIMALGAQMVELEARGRRHSGLAADWLAQREAEARARAEALAARLASLDEALERAGRLAASGTLSATRRAELSHERDALAAEWRAASAAADSLALEGRAVAQGIALDQGAGEGLHVRQALDARGLQRSELEVRKARIARDLDAARIRTGQARATLARQTRFAPLAPAVGAVWTDSPPVGSAVMTGDAVAQVLDCGQRFLEVTVSERHFGRLDVGTPASVRLRGTDQWRPTQVISMMGSGALLDSRDTAARARKIGAGEVRVLLSHPDPEAEPARFCDVGRSVEVRFHTPGPPAEAWAWLAGLDLWPRLAAAARDLAGRPPAATPDGVAEGEGPAARDGAALRPPTAEPRGPAWPDAPGAMAAQRSGAGGHDL